MESKDTQKTPLPHQVIMQDRNRLDVTGVSDVERFDDTVVVAFTSLGQLTVKGRDLQVRRLDLEGGNLSLDGQIDALSYSDAVHSGSLLGRLLR